MPSCSPPSPMETFSGLLLETVSCWMRLGKSGKDDRDQLGGIKESCLTSSTARAEGSFIDSKEYILTQIWQKGEKLEL